MDKYSLKYDIDKSLILAIIKAESNFDISAISNRGACGIMQVMPDTAKWLENNITTDNLMDVDTNIRLGTKYLKYLMKKYNGNIIEVLAAYNAGEGNVDRWIDRKAHLNNSKIQKLTIEDIEYSETRFYVTKVLKYQNYYEFLYNLE